MSMGIGSQRISGLEVLSQLTSQDITISPERAIGYGEFGFWNAVTKHCPTTRHQC
ncbi:hypothetical protein BTN49_0030 [Candidatus Enterovibrio escicola]|uniref:Mobile element protein n=1 Tax=Candidatus Enterovibrio escicola TaxID=1927127 RepID=A0A2A5T7V3_9GAMM|nr:hypothetical protein BTN49_0030 [Candidatus Enterovibrio escacola]